MDRKRSQTNGKPNARAAARPSRTHLALSWAIVLLWLAFIFFMSSRTSDGLDGGMGFASEVYRWLKAMQADVLGPGIDVIAPFAHFLEYAVLGALFANLLSNYMPLRRAMVLAIVLASAYGVTDEVHQYFVPGRMCDPLDWLVDTVGAGVGSACWMLVATKRTEGKRKKEGKPA